MWKHNFMFYCSFFVQQKGSRRRYVLVAVKNQQGSVYLVGEQPAEKNRTVKARHHTCACHYPAPLVAPAVWNRAAQLLLGAKQSGARPAQAR